ncbi:MAG: hypothetical protein ACOC5T_05065 [Elusimicrobiota bacterium]
MSIKRIETKQYKIVVAQALVKLPNVETLEIPDEFRDEILGTPEEEISEDQENIGTEENLPEVTYEDIPLEDEQVEQEVVVNEPNFEEIREPKSYPEFKSTFQAIRWAKDNHKVMIIDYITDRGTQIYREVEPHGDFWARTTNNRILVTYDKTIGGIRSFIVDNIMDYKFNGKRFIEKFNFSKNRRNRLRRIRYRKRKENR